MARLEGLSQEELKRIEELEAKIRSIRAQQKAIKSRGDVQRRKDDTRRAVVAGKLLLRVAANDADLRVSVHNILKNGVIENQRYLFPEIWPKAVRVVRKRQKTEEAAAPAGKS
jgi:hypothetical protein